MDLQTAVPAQVVRTQPGKLQCTAQGLAAARLCPINYQNTQPKLPIYTPSPPEQGVKKNKIPFSPCSVVCLSTPQPGVKQGWGRCPLCSPNTGEGSLPVHSQCHLHTSFCWASTGFTPQAVTARHTDVQHCHKWHKEQLWRLVLNVSSAWPSCTLDHNISVNSFFNGCAEQVTT